MVDRDHARILLHLEKVANQVGPAARELGGDVFIAFWGRDHELTVLATPAAEYVVRTHLERKSVKQPDDPLPDVPDARNVAECRARLDLARDRAALIVRCMNAHRPELETLVREGTDAEAEAAIAEGVHRLGLDESTLRALRARPFTGGAKP